MFIFVRWHHSYAAVSPDKYECDSRYLDINDTFTKSIFSETQKWTNLSLISNPQLCNCSNKQGTTVDTSTKRKISLSHFMISLQQCELIFYFCNLFDI